MIEVSGARKPGEFLAEYVQILSKKIKMEKPPFPIHTTSKRLIVPFKLCQFRTRFAPREALTWWNQFQFDLNFD